MYGFLVELKAFYMKRIPRKEGETGLVCTENCDLPMPGVGEIVGEYCNIFMRTRADDVRACRHEDYRHPRAAGGSRARRN